MKPQHKQLIGRKRKLTEKEEPAAKRLKTSAHKASPNATDIDALKQELFTKYHTKFAWTFLKFWDFIQSITSPGGNPLAALNALQLRLVGPFQYLNGDLDALSDSQILTHYRYHFDLPELQTIMIETESADQMHYGLWRDDPNYNPIGICKTDGNTKVIDKTTPMVHPIASNCFFFIQHRIQTMDKKTINKKDKERIECIENALNAFAKTHNIKLDANNKMASFKERKKRILCQTFSGFGLVVPMKGDIGYRSNGYSVNELKRILKRMNTNKTKKRKVDGAEMEMILTNICLADDEGDPGMGYEIGIDLFYSYPMFEKHARRLLMNAYNLTKRDGFKKILVAHLEVRGKRNGKCNELRKKKKGNVAMGGKKGNSDNKKITQFFIKKKNTKGSGNNCKTLDDLSSDDD